MRFTFHDFVAPVIRAMSGLAARREVSVDAIAPHRILSFAFSLMSVGPSSSWSP
jgi:hypothetical protein